MATQIVITESDAESINADKLQEDIEAAIGAAIVLNSSSVNGVLVSATIELAAGGDFTGQQETDIAGVVASHDHTQLSSTQQAIVDRAAVESGAETAVSAIPGWATWTEAEAQTWWTDNILTPWGSASTNPEYLAVIGTFFTTVMPKIITLLIGLRNKNWPNLEGSS